MLRSTNQVRNITLAAVFAAIDYVLAMMQIHIPSPVGHPFIDLGFTFVVIGMIFLGFKYGIIAGLIGLVLFDFLNGYAAHAYLTVMEVLMVGGVATLTFNALGRSMKGSRLIVLGITTGITKMISGYLRYVIEALMVGSHFNTALAMGVAAVPASVAAGIAMMITVPLFGIILYRVIHHLRA